MIDKKKAKALKAKRAPATAQEDRAMMDMINQDRAEAPSDTYNGAGMAEAVNQVTKTGEPLRRKYSGDSEAQRASDKKAYMLMMKQRRQGK